MADELPIVTGPGRLILDANRQNGRGGNPRTPKPRFVPGKAGQGENRDDESGEGYFPEELPTELVQTLDRMRTVGDLTPPSEETTRKILRGQLYYQRLPAPTVDLQSEPPGEQAAEPDDHPAAGTSSGRVMEPGTPSGARSDTDPPFEPSTLA